MRRLTWLPNGSRDYLYWQKHDRKLLMRVNEVIQDALRNPFTGMGKPEPLRNHLKGWWSRRTTQELRLIYRVDHDRVVIMPCRFRYDD